MARRHGLGLPGYFRAEAGSHPREGHGERLDHRGPGPAEASVDADESEGRARQVRARVLGHRARLRRRETATHREAVGAGSRRLPRPPHAELELHDAPARRSLRHTEPVDGPSPPVRIPDEAKKPVAATGLAHALGYVGAPLSTVRAWPDVPNSRLPDAVLNDDPYPVRGLIMQAINPVMSDPNRDAMQSMFSGLELAVAFELYLSESALECDVVLPETSFYEHAEIRQGMWMCPQAILCQPAVAPVGESRPMYDIVKDLATRLGWGEHFMSPF